MAKPPRLLRLCYAAAHVVLHDAYAALDHRLERPGDADSIHRHIDWATTMQIRQRLAAHGLGIAEAMDTAQRFYLGWPGARELIVRCGRLRLPQGFCAGAGTDHLPQVRGPQDLVDGVVFQARLIQRCGGIPVLLPMPWLSLQGADAATYVWVYRRIVRQLQGPLLVHWLGAMFLPSLAGYFPGDSFRQVMALDRRKLRGCKLSLLDAGLEVTLRRELLRHDQLVLTGDDFHFGRLILGGDADGAAPAAVPAVQRWTELDGRQVALGDFSHALLGILDGIAAPTERALQALARGDAQGFLDLMLPCEALGQHVFAAPTQHYKAGLAYLAYRNGWQGNAMLINREDLARDQQHYATCERLARACGALQD